LDKRLHIVPQKKFGSGNRCDPAAGVAVMLCRGKWD
jgi:hypothetical protein